MCGKLVQVKWHQKGQGKQCTAELVGKYRFRFDPLHKPFEKYHNNCQQNSGANPKQDTCFISRVKMKNNIDTGDHKNTEQQFYPVHFCPADKWFYQSGKKTDR